MQFVKASIEALNESGETYPQVNNTQDLKRLCSGLPDDKIATLFKDIAFSVNEVEHTKTI